MHNPSALALAVGGVWAACLAGLAAADSLDISVRLYRDVNCFERAEELLLLDTGCYANLYSNLTKAYSLKVVGFTNPGRSNLFEYTDDCNYQRTVRPLTHGRCERFTGPFWAILGTRERSSTCTGPSCSTLSVAVQNFFREPGCIGLATTTLRFPMQNACVRYYNGTQTFRSDLSFRNITQANYMSDDGCAGNLVQTLTIYVGRCYAGFFDEDGPRSFIWTIDRGVSLATSRTPRLANSPRAGPVMVAAAALLASPAVLGA